MARLAFAALAALARTASAAVKMPAIFSDGMVLQCQSAYDQRPFFYGQADPGEFVVVNRTASSGGKVQESYMAQADETGSWISQLNAECGSGNYTFLVAGSSDNFATVTAVHNVTYGDVFVCSGQSNMVFSTKSAFNASQFTNQSWPNIRLFPIVQAGSYTPEPDVPAYNGSSTPCWWTQNDRPWNSTYRCNTWQMAAPGITDEFSAACFITGWHIAQQFPGRNIGLVYGAVCGTPMQAWTPAESVWQCNGTTNSNSKPAADAVELSSALAEHNPLLGGPVNPNDPSVLWNAIIHPISRFAMRAVIWYQGESDSGDDTALFSCKFQALIAAWRKAWRIGDFAWHFVQLAPQDTSRWPQYYIMDARLGQAAALPTPGINTTDVTGMAVAYDLGDMGSPFPPAHVHPRRKVEVGRRLAAAVLHTQYAYQWPLGGANLTGTVNWRGPVAVSAVLQTAAPRSLRASGSSPTSSTGAGAGSSSAAAAAGVTVTVAFDTLDGLGIYTADTPDCWECCAGGQDTVQLSDSYGATWVNATFALVPGSGNVSSIVITPVGATPSDGFTQMRYAPNLWPQCAIYAVGNQFPVAPFYLNLTTASSAAVAQQQVQAPVATEAPVEVGSAVRPYIAKRGPKTWTEWKGRAIPAASSAPVLAATPPMGFNSWNGYHCNIDESVIRAVADTFLKLGLAQAGYEFVNIDDCWVVDRWPNGTIVPDPVRFPSGIRATADYVHSKGLKFGVYTAQHENTCQYRPGSYQHETIDAATYCEWGVDYLKVDGCWGASWPQLNTSWILFKQGFELCTASSGRPIVLSVETCGTSNQDDCQAWIPELANLWRTTNDIQATWGSMLSNLDNNNPLAPIAGPGHWNDPDMLQVGNPGLSQSEQQAHFTAWAIVAAPLLIGTDVVSGMTAQTLAILTALEVIAVNQDPLGVQGVRVSQANGGGAECWARPLADGSVAAMLINRGLSNTTVSCTWQELGLKQPNGAADVRDLWQRSDLGSFTGSYGTTVAGHSAMLVKVTQ